MGLPRTQHLSLAVPLTNAGVRRRGHDAIVNVHTSSPTVNKTLAVTAYEAKEGVGLDPTHYGRGGA